MCPVTSDAARHAVRRAVLWIVCGGLLSALLAVPGSVRAEECAETHRVDITWVFTPEKLTIRTGDCVRWVNVHGIEHSAVGLAREFHTGTLMPGSSQTIEFDEPADMPYICGIHPPMKGHLTVVEADR